MILEAIKLEEQGKLDAALEHYLAAIQVDAQVRSRDLYRSWCFDIREAAAAYSHLASWAARPHQTAAQILAAERQLKEATPHFSRTDPIKLEYVYQSQILRGDLAPLPRVFSGKETPPPLYLTLWLQLPWERARALRLLNIQTRFVLAEPGFPDFGKDSRESVMFLRNLQVLSTPCRERELLSALRREIGLVPVVYNWERDESGPRRSWLTAAERSQPLETVRNATRVILALEAWKLDHGSLPKRLEELVGHYLDRLPPNPFSGESFRYLPAGLSMPLAWSQPLSDWVSFGKGTIPAKTPFVWSTGMNVRRELAYSPVKRMVDVIRTDQRSDWHRPRSEYDVWEAGWPFPIP